LSPYKKGDILFLGYSSKNKQGENMSSTAIVRDSRILIQNKLLPSIPTKWWPQLAFGLEAFSLRPFRSAGSNARSVVANANTAASKVRRLLGNDRLANQLGNVFDQLGLVRPGSFVNVDHSDMHGLTALVGARQTRHGRAIPVFVETTYAQQIPAHNDKKRWQKLRAAMVLARKTQSFTGHTIDALQDFADRLGFWPKLVFDRGFGNESIVTHLAAEGATFYIRLKAGRFVELDDGKTVTRLNVKSLKEKDTTIRLYGLTLRVIRSPKNRRAKEPWYILTNDQQSSRTKVVRIYYHRFEIEETFKDAKHLFELHQLSFLRPNSLKVVLWLVFLGIALLYLVTKPGKQQTDMTNSKKSVSWVRQAYEQFERELMSYRGLTGLTPRYGVEE
jgi:Transposase DDE domain